MPLKVLVIDDERPALDELAWLLGRQPDIGEILAVDSATDALRLLQGTRVDAVFLDIQMPGLTGLELGQVLSRFRSPPPIVSSEEHTSELKSLIRNSYAVFCLKKKK